MRFSDKRTPNGIFFGFFAAAPVQRLAIARGVYLFSFALGSIQGESKCF
jgi:hypothetical protein